MFEISLQKHNPGSAMGREVPEIRVTDERVMGEFDSFVDLLPELCERLHSLNVLEFHIAGFGNEPWKVDIWYDLLTFIEQLPSLLEWIESGGRDTFELDFYGQGIERSLIFKVNNTDVEIECESRTDWQPDPKIEKSDLAALDGMFSRLLITFVSQIKRYFPGLTENEFFLEWSGLPSINKRLKEVDTI